MANDKKQYETLVSPRGVAVWPHLHAPDTKFNADGVFHVKLAFDPSDKGVPEFLALLDERQSQAVAQAKADNPKIKNALNVNDAVKDETDDEGEATGRKIVSFKMYSRVTNKKTKETREQKPRFFDAKLKPITDAPRVSGGSVLRIGYSVSPYLNGKNVGISLYLSQVQVIELVEFSGGRGPAAGFEQEEGFTVSESVGGAEIRSAFAGADESTDDDGSGDF